MNGPKFTKRWFTIGMRKTLEVIFPDLANRAIGYLEIGLFEGMSMHWMHERCLKHPGSWSVGIDDFSGESGIGGDELRERCCSNLARHKGKLAVIDGSSLDVLPRLGGGLDGLSFLIPTSGPVRYRLQQPIPLFDAAVVDGTKDPEAIKAEADLLWPLLKVQAVVAYDDYSGPTKVGIDAGLAGKQFEVIPVARKRLAVRKT